MAKRRKQRAEENTGFEVGPGTIVSLRYELFDAEGERVEQSDAEHPIDVLVGYGDVAPRLERALAGLRAGEGGQVVFPPDEAFGPRDPAAFIEVDRNEFSAGIAPGDEFEAEHEDGRELVPLKVVEVLSDVVVLDTNHPLSGQRIKLAFAVEAVRPASEEEMRAATERLLRAAKAPEPLLPADRLLRRGPRDVRRSGDEPPPRPTRMA